MSEMWTYTKAKDFLDLYNNPLSVSVARGLDAVRNDPEKTELDLNFVSLVLNRKVVPFVFPRLGRLYFEENKVCVAIAFWGNSISNRIRTGDLPDVDYGDKKYLCYGFGFTLFINVEKDKISSVLDFTPNVTSGAKSIKKYFDDKFFLNENAIRAYVAWLDGKMDGVITKYLNGELAEKDTETEPEQNENAA